MIPLLLAAALTRPQITFASWYRPKPAHVRMWGTRLLAASNAVPVGRMVRVERGGRFVVVRVCGTGPFAVGRDGRAIRPLRPHPTRGIDLSPAAFQRLAPLSRGVVRVTIRAKKISR